MLSGPLKILWRNPIKIKLLCSCNRHQSFLCPCSVHVVFGVVISGFEVIKKIEGLKTDSASRPYADVRVMDCGQLITKSANDGRFSDRSTFPWMLQIYIRQQISWKGQKQSSLPRLWHFIICPYWRLNMFYFYERLYNFCLILKNSWALRYLTNATSTRVHSASVGGYFQLLM